MEDDGLRVEIYELVDKAWRQARLPVEQHARRLQVRAYCDVLRKLQTNCDAIELALDPRPRRHLWGLKRVIPDQCAPVHGTLVEAFHAGIAGEGVEEGGWGGNGERGSNSCL